MTHDCDRATELLEQVKRKRDANAMVAALLQKNVGGCHCYQAGYLNGQQADGEWGTFVRSLEARAPWFSVYASLVLAGKLVAGLAGLEALEFASGFVFAGLAGFACTGWSMRAWRWLKGGASET